MCGIIGGVTNIDITPLLLDGLKRLEYRGYDSSGLVLLTKNNKLTLERAVGKVINLEKKITEDSISIMIIIYPFLGLLIWIIVAWLDMVN